MINTSAQVCTYTTELTCMYYTPLKVYQLFESLGSGSYGTVYKGRNVRNGRQVAIKQCQMDKKFGLPYTTVREVSILKELSTHRNIVHLLDVSVEPSHINLVFELIPMNLHEYIQTWEGPIPICVIHGIVSQILEGIAFCHDRRIIHRDLKPSNILVTDTLQVKIADFGISKSIGIPHRPHTVDIVTLHYRAPELILGENDYTTGVDMWSIGCIMYELYTKSVLFRGENGIDQLNLIYKTLGSPDEQSRQYLDSLPHSHVKYPHYVLPSPTVIEANVEDANLRKAIVECLRYIPLSRPFAKSVLTYFQK